VRVQNIIRQLLTLLWRIVREFIARWFKEALKKVLYYVVAAVLIVAFVAMMFSLFR
jgi:hypothetical protein